ncbi:MAG: hypothetical protein A2W99_03070 [Bacteroidetes bacterium GWF2_33_16]|nr:MAG: hypothetical protein A2X00_09945 [Bacteroidetes bacterium GWE2_32_14]OFY07876.1 MAG: hypothetical protein A2W99_03070 [Bacteroidetes bacterium GWF2_33_16]
MNLKKTILILVLYFIANCIFAQNCRNFHKENCKTSTFYDYKYYGQSRSAVMIANQTVQHKAVFYGRKDYQIIFCTESNHYPVHFVVKNIENDIVLYDNIIDDYVESIGFTIDYTQSLLFEITVIADEENQYYNMENRICLGMQIVWRRIGSLGFYAGQF